jgi:hypothetical protein
MSELAYSISLSVAWDFQVVVMLFDDVFFKRDCNAETEGVSILCVEIKTFLSGSDPT